MSEPGESGVTAPPVDSIIIAEAEKPRGSLFAFADPGGYVWWAGVILGALGSCFVASVIVIAVKAAQHTAPVLVFDYLGQQSCPSMSPLMETAPVTFMEWLPTCKEVSPGTPYLCQSSADCAALSPDCAAPSLLRLMTCEAEEVGGGRAVCKANLAAGRTAQELPNGGFCTSSSTRCAWCADWWNCSALSECVPVGACNTTTHPSTWQCTSPP